MKLPLTNRSEVENLIPQKHPFVMVDALLDFSETGLSASFTIPESNIFVEDGIFLAPGLLEHQAQSVALHTGFQYFKMEKEAPTGYIGAVKSFSVASLPKTGERITSFVEILAELEGVTLVRVETTLDGEKIAASEMKTVLA